MNPEDMIGHLLNLLDADEQQQIQECLEHDARAKSLCQKLACRLAVLSIDRVEVTPPPTLAVRTCQHVRIVIESHRHET